VNIERVDTPDILTPISVGVDTQTPVSLRTLSIDAEEALGMQWEYVDRSPAAPAQKRPSIEAKETYLSDETAGNEGDDGAVTNAQDMSDTDVVKLLNLSHGLPAGSRASARDAPAASAGAA
jgi:hypothetical protein